MTMDEQIDARLQEIGYREQGAGEALRECLRAGHLVTMVSLPSGEQYLNAFPGHQVGTLKDCFPGLVE